MTGRWSPMLQFRQHAGENLEPEVFFVAQTVGAPLDHADLVVVEEIQFIIRAVNLSEAQIEAGRLASEKSSTPAIKAFGQRLVTEYEKQQQAVARLAQSKGVAVREHPSKPHWQQELERLEERTGQEFDHSFMKWQLQMHLALVNLYQAEASGSPETDMAKFAITTLVEIQRVFDQAKQLGAEQGVSIDTVKAPPQY